MKPSPTDKPNRSRLFQSWWQSVGTFIKRHIWFLAIALISAGLVLMLGAQLEQTFFAPRESNPVSQGSAPSNPPIAAGPSGGNSRGTMGNSDRPPTANPSLQIPPQFSTQTRSPQSPSLPNAPNASPNASSNASPRLAQISVQRSFGHFPYGEALPERLMTVGNFVRDNYSREEFLEGEAAQAFLAMVTAARSQGVQLMGISGFRSIADQQALFTRQVQRHGSPTEAAKWSAPPGYSEHHTGYAIDIADMTRSDTDVKVNFEETPAYQWLAVNAHRYGFEQSFPRDNPQGVSYEPWHWRYVVQPRASQIFAAARSFAP
jgi:zinc D-Ala-D-Ala carboxypeptidase